MPSKSGLVTIKYHRHSVFSWLLVLVVCGTVSLSPILNQSASAEQSLPKVMTGLTPADWELYEQVKRFKPVDLYEQINGAAELYLAYGVKELTFASYISRKDTNFYLDLSVFDMGNPTNAFGIFSVERFSSGPTIELGRDAYQSEANFFIWHGQYYLKIVSSDHTKDLENLGLEIGRNLTRFLPDSGQTVWGLVNLPQAGLIKDTMKYFRVDAMGLDFMNNTYTARYQTEGAEIQTFVSWHDSSTEAMATLRNYEEYAAKYGKGCLNRKVNGTDIFLCDMKGDFDAVFSKGALVGGVSSVKDGDLAVKAAAIFRSRLVSE